MRIRSRRPIASLSPTHRHTVANRLRLLGGATLDTGAGPVTGRAAQRHRVALLALLSTTRRLYRGRDQLVALLWPEADAERGRKLLSDSIYRINQALGGDAIAGTGDDIRLNRGRVGSDVADLEAAAESHEWRRVVELYAGPFLDGFYLPGAADFDHWMEGERAQYARIVAKAIEALAVEARDDGRAGEAVEWWQRLAAHAPDDSRVAMELMRALESSGNRAGALRHARVHASLLRDTLGVEPDRSLLRLADDMTRRSPALAHSIAVIPFTSMTDGDGSTQFAHGVSEELMLLLSRYSGLRVASRTSALAHRDVGLDIRELARRLGVDWIVEGSVRRSDATVRFVVRLIDANTGFHVWSEPFEQTSTNVFAIQTDVAAAIANRIVSAMDGLGVRPAR